METVTNTSVRLSAVVMLGVAALLGCAFTEDRKEAEALAEQYFAKAKAEDMDGVLALYSPRFFSVTSREKWRKFLEEQRSRCGTPQSHAVITWNVFTSIGTNSGTRTTLVYDVKYSSCRMQETITVFRPSGGAIQIQGHFFKPKEGDPAPRKESDTYKA